MWLGVLAGFVAPTSHETAVLVRLAFEGQEMAEPVRVGGRDLKPHKATVNPKLAARTVLTTSHWEYVSLWLKREHKPEVSLYWQQAQAFAARENGVRVPYPWILAERAGDEAV